MACILGACPEQPPCDSDMVCALANATKDIFLADWFYAELPDEECWIVGATIPGEEETPIMARTGVEVVANYIVRLHQANLAKRRAAKGDEPST